ncbi:MAG: sugar ABC transporter permease [Chloroflexota bacterium]|nr:sugar ABC transporter permease [Chloroflexota bacterium]MDP6758412.1 sugar ABC transporter permease [Chloroflexota bacterium]
MRKTIAERELPAPRAAPVGILRGLRAYFRQEQARYGTLFVLPTLAFFLIFIVFPLGFSLYMSFLDWHPVRGDPEFVGIENYVELLGDKTFVKTVVNTLVLTFGVVAITVVGALALAMALNQGLRGTAVFRGVFYSPVVTSLIATGLVFLWLFDPQFGPINQLLKSFGITGPGWASSLKWALPTMILTFSWREIGYFVVVYLAGLQGIPVSLREAAAIDGAGSWGQFRHVTWPLLWPTTFFVLIMGVIRATQYSFGMIYVMTAGGPVDSTNVVVLYLYQQAFELFRMGYASAIAYVLFVIVFAISMIQYKFAGRLVDY